MSQKITTLRIDEILLWEGLVTEEQIKTALEYQREHGGRFGSHLLRLGYIDEAGLLKALSKQFDCESVLLSSTDLPAEVPRHIPADVAIARTVIPFDYDPESNILKIACEDPTDEDLINELNLVAGGKKVQLYVAAEMPLRTAVAKHYLATAETRETSPSVSGGPNAADSQAVPAAPSRGSILLVSDEQDNDMPLRQALEQENFQLVSADSADAAIDIIGSQSFHTVFIRDTVQGDYIDLIDRLRKISPRTNVRYYESPAQLLLNKGSSQATSDLVIKNLQLLTSLLASRDNLAENHAGTVGRYVDRLCKQLGIPEKDHLSITNAAYVHDISRFYYGESKDTCDSRARVAMTAKLLDSLNYSPLVIGILRSMYVNIRQKYTKRLPIEMLGGNILTIVDMFCEHVSVGKKMTLDKFKTIRSKLIGLSGKLFLPETVDAFVEMIEEEILIEPTSEGYNQALMYCSDTEQLKPIAQRLKDEGLRPVMLDSLDRFVELYRRSRPDMIILLERDRASRAISLVDELTRAGVQVTDVPTFLLTTQKEAAQLASLFEQGLEDIIPIENNLDLLVVKMRKLRARIEGEARQHSASVNSTGTAGNLEDMNLIDLLQALGPSCKTAKIKVTSNKDELTLYLDKGRITFAEGGGKAGPEAVYEGLSWSTGKWIVQPVTENDLPEPNNQQPNESILMEGCRLLDEKVRTPSP